VLFVGAGVSAGVSWAKEGTTVHGPSWSELVDRAAEILGFADADLLRVRGTDLQILEYFRRKRHDQIGELTSWLTGLMQPTDAELKDSIVHEALAKLDRCSIFYTTNYDDFLERALRLHGRACDRIAIEGHIADAISGSGRSSAGAPAEVVKFHGDLQHVNTMVLSEQDYEERLKLETALDHRFRTDMLGRAVLFLGYSFRDWNVAYLFRLVNDVFGPLPSSMYGRRAYIAVADPSDFERTLFQARNIDVIPIGSASRSEDIVALLQEMGEPPND
jgi:hypothetical protein